MKKRILFIIPSLEIGGGAERVVSNLSAELSTLYKVFILTFHNVKNHYSFKGYFFSLNEPLYSWRKIFRPVKMYRMIKKISPEVILSFMDHVNLLSIFVDYLFHLDLPLIISIRGNPKMAYLKENRYINYLIKILYNLNRVNKIITVSREIKYILVNDYHINPKKIKPIYNAVELRQLEMIRDQEVSDHPEIFKNGSLIKFITIGRLSGEKGQIHLIKAFQEVKREVPNSKLIIIGEGPLKEKFNALIKEKNLQKDILLLGKKKNPYKYLSKSDIFVLSSIHEGFPMVLLEALACGLPIISTDCPTGPREILENDKYGLLVKVGDIDDLAKNMILLAQNPSLLKKYSTLSLERIQFFNQERIFKEWIEIIENIKN